jgi:hypothetical protein
VCGGSRGSLEKVDAPAASVTTPGVHSGGKRVNDLDRVEVANLWAKFNSRLGAWEARGREQGFDAKECRSFPAEGVA